MCDKSICKPLQLIFSQCIDTGSFPLEWKKANVIPVHKKGDKQCQKNYRPVSLLPICGQIFERLIFNEIFKKTIWFPQTNLVSSQETPADSYILTFIYKPQNMYVFWWQIWSKRCFSWYLNSVWQKLARGFYLRTKTKWDFW